MDNLDYDSIIDKTVQFINEHLFPIIEEINEPLEGNLFTYNLTRQYFDEFKLKQKNVIKLTNFDNVKKILEIGFNSGFSAVLFLNSNPNINITCVDIGIHQYTIPCYNKIKEFYGDRIKLLIGSSLTVVPYINNNFDLIHIDGAHDPIIAREDIINSYYKANDKCLIIMDDCDIPHLNTIWNELSSAFEFNNIDDLFVNKYHDIKQVNKYKFFPLFNSLKQSEKIPKIVHQIAPKDKTKWHPVWETCQQTWLLNFPSPEYEYKLWSDEEDIENLIKNDFPFFYNIFMSYPKKIQRIDMARYFILIKHGGVYADMDYYCYKNFYNLVEQNKASIPNSPFTDVENLQNSLMISPVNHTFFYNVIDEAIRRSSNPSISDSTGPKLISYVYYRLKNSLNELDKELYNPIPCIGLDNEKYNGNTCYCKHYGTGCW
jgi:mannosyltransferase OCH1-like enzyme